MSTPEIPQKLMVASLSHFERGITIDRLNISENQRERLARVDHVYWQWKRNPFLEPFELTVMPTGVRRFVIRFSSTLS